MIYQYKYAEIHIHARAHTHMHTFVVCVCVCRVGPKYQQGINSNIYSGEYSTLNH